MNETQAPIKQCNSNSKRSPNAIENKNINTFNKKTTQRLSQKPLIVSQNPTIKRCILNNRHE